MTRLRLEKLHVTFLSGIEPESPLRPRKYTLTHSDLSGDLYITIGKEYNTEQFSGLYSRFMRDEVLAEWKKKADEYSLEVYCHVSGGFVLGSAGWRYKIFREELALVLEALRYGDRMLFENHPELDKSRIFVNFQSANPKYNRVENWGSPEDYKI